MTTTLEPPEGTPMHDPHDNLEIVAVRRRCAVEDEVSSRVANGAPVRVTEPALGVRGLRSLTFAFLGVVVTVDHLPALPKAARNVAWVYAHSRSRGAP